MAVGMRGLAMHGAEGIEVVFADQQLRRALHGVGIQRRALPTQGVVGPAPGA